MAANMGKRPPPLVNDGQSSFIEELLSGRKSAPPPTRAQVQTQAQAQPQVQIKPSTVSSPPPASTQVTAAPVTATASTTATATAGDGKRALDRQQLEVAAEALQVSL